MQLFGERRFIDFDPPGFRPALASVGPAIASRLQMVLEIRNTGDIFFPKRWADATLGGPQSPATAAAVRSFINGLPADYPQRLRWVLEASADPLFRAAR